LDLLEVLVVLANLTNHHTVAVQGAMEEASYL
jgi:hypothetical protein